ncbi:hypothetical protein HPB48_027004 [Haemaphysalis longicornis]|uniref:Organic cation/carnitine transporter n=1 Tax=Haemaphysalis longicornis TaxID=44386 RepID=A0A9J6HCW3_HAELO|nr:hypothetical protein HPB48_027004 [Haemaphysalis longicornis]
MATDVFNLSMRVMDHWCERPAAFAELSAEKWKQMAIPRYPNGSYSKCTVRDSQDAGAPAVVAHCQAWQFNLTQFGHNAVSEWSLVCHRAYLRDVSEAVNRAATVIVVPLVGMAADHIGRKAVTIVALTALLLALIVSTVALNFTTFAVMASVVAASSRSLSALFVLLYEVTTASRRCLYCTLAPTLPVVLAPLFKYLVDSLKVSWSLSYQLLAAISFVLLATFWFIEESSDWLLAPHKPEEAERVVLKLASVNSVSTRECRALFRKGFQRLSLQLSAETLHFRPQSRSSAFLLAFSWFVVSWGHTYDSRKSAVTANVYVLFGVAVSVVPLFLVIWPFLKGGKGVKRVMAISMLVSSACSALLFVPHSDHIAPLEALLLVAMRLFNSLCLILIFLLTVSFCPTTLRCTAVATGMAIGNFTGKAGQLFFEYVIAPRNDIALGVAAVLMALAAVATEHLPSKHIRSLASARITSHTTALSRPSAIQPDLWYPEKAATATCKGSQTSVGRQTHSTSVGRPERFLVRPAP